MTLPARITRHLTHPVDLVQNEFDNAIRHFFGERNFFGNDGTTLGTFGVDIRETPSEVHIEAELPGFQKEEIDLSLDQGTLTIAAERREASHPSEQDKGDYLVRERRYERLQRSFALPTSVDDQKVDAKYENGLLMVTLHKREENKPRKISLQ